MQLVACAAPFGTLEPAPLTSLPIEQFVGNAPTTAFWGDDEGYYLQAVPTDGSAPAWYCVVTDAPVVADDLEDRLAAAALMADIIPLGGGKVAFPIGSSGRRVYRVWRAGANGGKTRILEVRAVRSRRRPA